MTNPRVVDETKYEERISALELQMKELTRKMAVTANDANKSNVYYPQTLDEVNRVPLGGK
jgi:hypothetical protein